MVSVLSTSSEEVWLLLFWSSTSGLASGMTLFWAHIQDSGRVVRIACNMPLSNTHQFHPRARQLSEDERDTETGEKKKKACPVSSSQVTELRWTQRQWQQCRRSWTNGRRRLQACRPDAMQH
eukprot:5512272-Amphidinium_carterae.1